MPLTKEAQSVFKVTPLGIYGFFEEYRFLSNFHVCPVTVYGLTYSSSEAAYMAQKSLDPKVKEELTKLSPKEAREFGKLIIMRPYWDAGYRVLAMDTVVSAKFAQNPDLLEKLLATKGKYLEETNYWGDSYWGVCKGAGANMLGQILMSIREHS